MFAECEMGPSNMEQNGHWRLLIALLCTREVNTQI